MVNSNDTDQYIDAIQSLKTISFRNEMIANGLQRAAQFSWDTCWADTLDFYETIWQQKFAT